MVHKAGGCRWHEHLLEGAEGKGEGKRGYAMKTKVMSIEQVNSQRPHERMDNPSTNPTNAMNRSQKQMKKNKLSTIAQTVK